jgi:4-amino-4-deoxy-L-arabinose transferase-like glycosyltransferase
MSRPTKEGVGGVLVGAALASAFAVLPGDLGVALAVASPPVALVALWLRLRGDEHERQTLVPIFLAAFAVRVGVAIVIAYAAPDGYFALDDQRYSALGQELARHWAGQGSYPDDIHGAVGYYVWNAAIFAVVGPVPLAATFLNGALGAGCTVLAWSLARAIGGETAARYAALLTAFFPSLVLWSSLNLKDALAVAAILVCVRAAQRLHARFTPGPFAAIALGLAILGELRGYLALVAGAALAVAIVVPRLGGRRAPVSIAALLAVGALLMVWLGPIEGLGDEASLESLDRARRELAFGASAYQGDADISTPSTALSFLPIGLGYFLLAPAPWQMWNTRQLLSLPEMLAWYAMLPQVAAGFLVAIRRRFGAALPLASFALFGTLSYALVESNLGTAYRHRAQVLVLFLVFGAIGLAQRKRAASSRTLPRRVATGVADALERIPA